MDIRAIIAAGSLLAATCVHSQDRLHRPYSFYWENDIGVFTEGTDEYYTNGLRLTVGTLETPEKATDFRRRYCALDVGPCERMGAPTELLSYGFTHQFWTPQNKLVRAPQPLDRPWAGYMYLSANLQIQDDAGEKEQHVFEAQVGVLGPAAGARWVQTEWHKIIGSAEPLGWGNQLKNEPVFNLLYVQNRRYELAGDNADLIVSPGAMLGTLFTYPTLSVTARVGRNITGFPTGPIAPAAAPLSSRADWEFYFHAGAEARYVVHNATLDGGFFRDGPSIDRRHGVYDLRGGFAVRWRDFRLTYNLVRRSEEFTAPPGSDESHYYNSLIFSYEPTN